MSWRWELSWRSWPTWAGHATANSYSVIEVIWLLLSAAMLRIAVALLMRVEDHSILEMLCRLISDHMVVPLVRYFPTCCI